MLRRAYGFVPESIFDTMEAARLLGHREFGLTHLVQKHLGVTLEKGPQKANWASRPLTKRMHIYARNDTRYLKPLADLLRAALLDKGRLDWHAQTCARVVANSGQPREIGSDQIWRLSGSHRLDRVGLAVLRELWRWREQQAIRANRPPYFVLSHEMLLSLALHSSRSRTTVNSLPHSVPAHYEPGLLAAINTALALPAEARPAIHRSVGRQRSEIERRRLEAIKKRRDVRASELSIDPTLIASRATLELLAENNEKHQEQLMGWQREVLL
jgi:ribonuclease D